MKNSRKGKMKKEICKERSLKEGMTGRGDRKDDGGSGEMKGEECVGKKETRKYVRRKGREGGNKRLSLNSTL